LLLRHDCTRLYYVETRIIIKNKNNVRVIITNKNCQREFLNIFLKCDEEIPSIKYD